MGRPSTTPDSVGTGADLDVARAQGDFLVHLALHGRGEVLCGRVVRPRPVHKSFREAGCRACLTIALHEGQVAAREGDRAWINLLRA